MAQYTNLTSLAGLNVGDVVIYNTATDIDLAGAKVKFEVIGNYVDQTTKNGYTYRKYGGYSCGIMNVTSSSIIRYSSTCSACFYFKNTNGTSWLYNRFIVAGNAGYASLSSNSGTQVTNRAGGNGGGLNGANGDYYQYSYYAATGGSQTSGGSGSRGTGGNGSFGYGGSGASLYAGTAGSGGAGWYGGGGGYYSGDAYSGGAGGSGYVLTTTSSKPTGYMTNNDFILEDTVLTTGGAQSASANYANTYNIGVITIIDIGFDPTTQTKIITNNLGVVTETVIDQGDTITNPGEPTHDSKYLFVCWCSDSALTTEYTFGGTATSDFIYLYAKYYQYVKCKTYTNDNNEIIPCKFYRWNGTSFDQIQINYIETVT